MRFASLNFQFAVQALDAGSHQAMTNAKLFPTALQLHAVELALVHPDLSYTHGKGYR